MATLGDLQSKRTEYFNGRRDQTIGQANANLQQNTDALQRRFTSMGAANTGAALQANQNAINQNDIAKRQALTDIGAQELQAGEGDIARQAQLEESQRGRDFSGAEAQKGRDFSGGLANQDFAFKKELAGTEQSNKLKQFDLAERQFAADQDTAAFNKRMAEIAANAPAPPGMFDGLFPKDIIGGIKGQIDKMPGGMAGVATGLVPGIIPTVTALLPSISAPNIPGVRLW